MSRNLTETKSSKAVLPGIQENRKIAVWDSQSQYKPEKNAGRRHNKADENFTKVDGLLLFFNCV